MQQDDHVALYPRMSFNTEAESSDQVEKTDMQNPGSPKPETVGAANLLILGPTNTVTTCPFCRASIKTAVQYSTTTRTHMAAALCGLVCCCCCIPYCSDDAKNSDHYCPNCQKFLGTYEK